MVATGRLGGAGRTRIRRATLQLLFQRSALRAQRYVPMLTRTFRAPLCALFLLAAPTLPPAPPTVVLLVRHAERAPGTGDVPISADGEARARDLVAVGQGAGVNAILTTQLLRTRQTAGPLASALRITPDVVANTGDATQHAAAVADTIRARFVGRTLLVVGHSNTIAPIVVALGGTRYRDLCDSEYDALFVVVIAAEGPVRTVRSRFGAPTPVGADCTPMR